MSLIELNAVQTIWKREMLHYVRSKSRIIGTLGGPLFYLLALGFGLGPLFQFSGISYIDFIVPGIIGMVLLFQSVFFGITVLTDKQFGFMKEMLVAPISRNSLVLGKVFSGMTIAVIQALIFLFLSLLFGFHFPSIQGFLLAVFFMFFVSFGFTCLGLIFGALLDDMQGFSVIMNFLIIPIFLLSGVFFPLNNLPLFVRVLSYVDPLSYGVDALRFSLTGFEGFNLVIDLLVLTVFSLITFLVTVKLFEKL